MSEHEDLLDINEYSVRRRLLLPWWIKIFIWIFFLFGLIVPFSIIFGVLGKSFQIALYSLETNHPFSITGLLLISLFVLKGIVAYGLWFEKRWAIDWGIVDAILGVIICTYTFISSLFSTNSFQFSFELLLLIPYLIYLLRIKPKWIN